MATLRIDPIHMTMGETAEMARRINLLYATTDLLDGLSAIHWSVLCVAEELTTELGRAFSMERLEKELAKFCAAAKEVECRGGELRRCVQEYPSAESCPEFRPRYWRFED